MKRFKIMLALFLLSCAACQFGMTETLAYRQEQAGAGVEKAMHRLRSADPTERASAACSLAKMASGAMAAIPSLVAMLADETLIEPIRCWESDQYNTEKIPVGRVAAKALAEIGPAALEPLMAAATKHDDWRVRKNAAWALGEMEYRSPAERARAMGALNGALEDDQWQIQKSAALALSEIKDRNSVDPLSAALRKTDWRVREAAAFALGEIADRAGVDALVAALRDERPEVRAAAAVALGEIKDQAAVGALKKALKDENAEVRASAKRALTEIRDSKSDPR